MAHELPHAQSNIQKMNVQNIKVILLLNTPFKLGAPSTLKFAAKSPESGMRGA